MRQDLRLLSLALFICFFQWADAQYFSLSDDFEGGVSNIQWAADNIVLDAFYPNPFPDAENPSATVLRYQDTGGQFANLRFTLGQNFNFTTGTSFSFKLYVPSDGITGSAPNQVSVKLQNGYVQEPWTSQSEIIRPIGLDTWQPLSFDFSSDDFQNFEALAPDPDERVDFNRIVVQLNGENNFNHVLAYIDDFQYDGLLGYDPADSESIYDELVWADEFDGAGPIDGSKWHHQTLLPTEEGWFNGEIQHYTDRELNSHQEDGSLFITVLQEPYTDQGLFRNYTSARLNSKFAFTYGRVEVRAKLPQGQGTWPAIWLLGKNIDEPGAYWAEEFGDTPWPACGEIDIMEHWTWNMNYVSSALHTPSSFGATVNVGGLHAPDIFEGWHVYGMEWTPDAIHFMIDGQVHYTYAPFIQDEATWPFDAEQYIIMNVAVQDFADFQSSSMEVDYVRVYQEGQPSSLEDSKELSFQLYPNPSSDYVRLEWPEEVQVQQLNVMDTQGRVVLRYDRTEVTRVLDVRSLAEGIYQLQGETADGRSIHRSLKVQR